MTTRPDHDPSTADGQNRVTGSLSRALMRNPARVLKTVCAHARAALTRLLAPVMARALISGRLYDQLVRHHAHNLYSLALIDDDGGEPSSRDYELYSRAAADAVSALYAEFGLPADSVPSGARTTDAAASRLRAVLEAEEREALAVLKQTGPSHRLAHTPWTADYTAAAEAEDTLAHTASVLAYLDHTSPREHTTPATAQYRHDDAERGIHPHREAA